MLRRLVCSAVALPLLALAGCPRGGAGAVDGVAAVHTGQRYRFVQEATPDGGQVYEVLAVEPTGVRYRVQTTLRGTPIGDPIELVFTGGVVSGAGPIEEHRVAGLDLRCEVREQEGLRSYTAVADGRERFPGVVEVVDLGTGEVELQLVEVSER